MQTSSGIYFGRAAVGLVSTLLFVWPAAGAQSAAPIPDFAGLWGRNSLDFEPPPSGPGPVVNTSHRLDMAVGDYTSPILKPAAAAEVKRRGEISLTGVANPTPSSQCSPTPPPYIDMSPVMELLQQPDRITILYMLDHEFRIVRMNQAHPAHVTPSWHGDSIGHYEGDTLVIDTIGIKVAPLSIVDIYGTPHSEALHVVERFRLIDGDAAKEATERNEKNTGRLPNGYFVDASYKGKGLQVQVTVEDAGVFTMPWSAFVTYRRGDVWEERVCAENTHEYYAGKDTQVPMAAKPDF